MGLKCNLHSAEAMDSAFFNHKFIEKKESEKKERKTKREMEGVLSALKELTLKVNALENHQTIICDIDFRDPKTSARLGVAPKIKNIIKFVKV